MGQGSEIRKVALGTLSGFIAFGFGSGLTRAAPGTVGTLAAIPIAIPLLLLPQTVFWLVWLVSFMLGVYVCGESCRMLGVHDHGGVVWDEMVAWWFIVAFIPTNAYWWMAGFLLFRLFDIIKPWPIQQVDQKVHGGFGIMVDDILAAVYTLAVLLPIHYVWGGVLPG